MTGALLAVEGRQGLPRLRRAGLGDVLGTLAALLGAERKQFGQRRPIGVFDEHEAEGPQPAMVGCPQRQAGGPLPLRRARPGRGEVLRAHRITQFEQGQCVGDRLAGSLVRRPVDGRAHPAEGTQPGRRRRGKRHGRTILEARPRSPAVRSGMVIGHVDEPLTAAGRTARAPGLMTAC
jgi:hypothetical protein